MKRICLAAVMATAALFTGCSVQSMSSLRELTKPYAGEYECTVLTLGGRDLMGEGDGARLTLTREGDFRLTYCMDGAEGEYTGSYTLDPEAGSVVFAPREGQGAVRYCAVYSHGAISLTMPLCGRTLYAKFAMP